MSQMKDLLGNKNQMIKEPRKCKILFATETQQKEGSSEGLLQTETTEDAAEAEQNWKLQRAERYSIPSNNIDIDKKATGN